MELIGVGVGIGWSIGIIALSVNFEKRSDGVICTLAGLRFEKVLIEWLMLRFFEMGLNT